MDFQDKSFALPDRAPKGPILLHTDVMKTHRMIRGVKPESQVLDRHLACITNIAAGRDLWFPSFNYDFLSTGSYSAQNSKGTVGALNEYFRTEIADWRSSSPVFNFSGNGAAPENHLENSSHFDPFGTDSDFAELLERDGTVLWYGAGYGSATLHHHAESLLGSVQYRYYKIFTGRADYSGQAKDLSLRFHVRPPGGLVIYDWDRLEDDARKQGLVSQLSDSVVFWGSARELTYFWKEKMEQDPLYMLTLESRNKVDSKLQALGRPFEIQDFESIESGN